MTKQPDLLPLKDSSMFKGLVATDLDKLANFCQVRNMAEGTTVFIENMPGESLFLVKKGAVHITKMFAEGDEETLVTLGPNDIFGELAVVDGLPRSATARISEDAELISLTKESFEKLCKEDACLALKLLSNIVKVFSERVHEAKDEYRAMLVWTLQKS